MYEYWNIEWLVSQLEYIFTRTSYICTCIFESKEVLNIWEISDFYVTNLKT